jgi:hypothetical protein
MSVTRTLEIQRHLGLDEQTMVTLRNFDVDWNCGTRFILSMIKNVVTGKEVGEILTAVMFDYKLLCQQGVSDYERLYYVLSSLFQKLNEAGSPLQSEQVAQLCSDAAIPQQIKEQLLNG